MSTTPTTWSAVAVVAAVAVEAADPLVPYPPGTEPPKPLYPPGTEPPKPPRPPNTTVGSLTAGAAGAVPVMVSPAAACTPNTAPAAMPRAPMPPITAVRRRWVGGVVGASAVSVTGPGKAPERRTSCVHSASSLHGPGG